MSLLKFKVLVIFIFHCTFVVGQDLHFSQFYASPLTTNPALTGNFNGVARLSSSYRIQWDNVNTNTYMYQTPSASLDINLRDQNIALGLVAINDQTNNKTFNTLEAGLSFAYKIKMQNFLISFGLQGWYSQTYLNLNKISNTVLQSESNLNNSIKKFDANAGIFSSYKFSNKNTIYCGSSIFHLLSPKDYYTLGTQKLSLPLKAIFHCGGEFNLSERVQLIPGLLAGYQAQSTQFNIGSTLAYNLRPEDEHHTAKVFAGLWTRFNETKLHAFIPKFGVEFERIRATISYDYVMNGLLTSTNQRPNTFEFSLNYILPYTPRSTDFGCAEFPYY
jgi:type IX secretion system PorP/SprF family membrane protein